MISIGLMGAAVLLSSGCAATHYQHGPAEVPSNIERLQRPGSGPLLPVAQRVVKNRTDRVADAGSARKDMIAMEARLNACMDLLYSRCSTEVARLQAENAMLRQRLASRLMSEPVVLLPPHIDKLSRESTRAGLFRRREKAQKYFNLPRQSLGDFRSCGRRPG